MTGVQLWWPTFDIAWHIDAENGALASRQDIAAFAVRIRRRMVKLEQSFDEVD